MDPGLPAEGLPGQRGVPDERVDLVATAGDDPATRRLAAEAREQLREALLAVEAPDDQFVRLGLA